MPSKTIVLKLTNAVGVTLNSEDSTAQITLYGSEPQEEDPPPEPDET